MTQNWFGELIKPWTSFQSWEKVFKVSNCKLFFSLVLLWRVATVAGLRTILKWPENLSNYGIGEGYKKLSPRFQVSVSTVRNIVRKWMTTGAVLRKDRMVRTVQDNPQTTSKDLQCHLAADGVTVHRWTIQRTLHKEKLYGRVMRKKPFLHTRHKQSRLRCAKAHLDKPASFCHFGIRCCGLMKQRLRYKVITRGVMRGGKRTQHSKKDMLPTVNEVEVPSCCGVVWPVPVLGIVLKLIRISRLFLICRTM